MSYLSAVVQRSAARFGVVLPATLVAFLGVGMTGLAVNLALLVTLEKLRLAFPLAYGIALVVATGVTWGLNRRVTFTASGRAAHHEALRYFAVAIAAQSLNYLLALALSTLAPHLPHVIDALFGAVVATVFSYTGQRFFTFAPPKADPKA